MGIDVVRIALERRIAEVDRWLRAPIVAETVCRALQEEHRWNEIEDCLGAVAAQGHEWDDDPAGWVRAQRFADETRVG